MIFEGPKKSPHLLEHERITEKLGRHKAKRVSEMTKPEQDELLEVIAQKLGLANDRGEII